MFGQKGFPYYRGMDYCSKSPRDKETFTELTALHLFVVIRHVVRSYVPQETHIFITMELGHLFKACLLGTLKMKGTFDVMFV